MSAHTPTPNETIEQAARNYTKNSLYNDPIRSLAFMKGANWQYEKMQSELESLRAERDGLVEALRDAQQVLVSEGWIVTGVYETLVKYEK